MSDYTKKKKNLLTCAPNLIKFNKIKTVLMIIIIIILKDFGQNRIKSPSKIKCVHSVMNMRMCTGIGNLGQKHLILAFLLFPHTTNKNKCTSGHNARGKLNIELILDRKLSRRSVL